LRYYLGNLQDTRDNWGKSPNSDKALQLIGNSPELTDERLKEKQPEIQLAPLLAGQYFKYFSYLFHGRLF